MAKKFKSLSFGDSAKARDAEVARIVPIARKGYTTVANQIHSQYRRFERSTSDSPTALRSLQSIVSAGARRVSKEIEDQLSKSMIVIAQAVAEDQADWVASIVGEDIEDYESYVDEVIDLVSSGKLYKGHQTLTKRVNAQADDLIKSVSSIISGGVRKGWTVYKTAMSVENFVRPDAMKQWDLTGKDGLRIWPAEIDRTAARTVRTTLQHAYEQAISSELQDNPFVEMVRWHASGPSPCPICKERDGRLYKPADLPLDHPNGMCTFEPVMVKGWSKRLGKWIDGGDDADIEEFMERYGIDLEDL